MNQPRSAAGSFISLDKSSFYAFGGSHDSVERLDLKNESSSWVLMNVEFPKGVVLQGGLTMLPMWHYCSKLENIYQDKVLIFGGGIKEVYSFDLTNNIVNEVHEKAEDDPSSQATQDTPSSGLSQKTLSISRDDWFIA